MALLRSILSEPAPEPVEAREPLIRIVSPKSETARLVARSMRQMEKEQNEVASIIEARPLGAQTPRDEPKSIHSPAGRAMISWEPPKKRKSPSRARASEVPKGLVREAGRSFHRPVRGEW